MDQLNPLPGRKTHRLNLDSQQEQKRQQEERAQREQYQRQKQQKRKRKQEKRKAKEQEERLAKEEAEKKLQERKKQVEKYNSSAILFQADSDSGVSFSRIKRKIEQMYPKYSKKKQRDQSEDSNSEDQGEQQQESGSSSESSEQSEQSDSNRKKKSKNNKKAEKRRQREQYEDEQNQQRRNNKNRSVVKVEPEMSAKDKLVQEVAVRWNYALPEWPPQNYDYQEQLKKRGYRNVQFSKFKFVEEVVDGLTKVYELDGYRGVYRSKIGLIDVRPKGQCPSLNYFYARNQEQLNQLLKKALTKQLERLQNLQFKQSGQQKLLQDLRRRVKQLVR